MARSVDSKFYKRKAWLTVRNAYLQSQFGLCERCGGPGNEVHHIKELNQMNISNYKIAYGFDNLELLCKSCHSQETFEAKPKTVKGLVFNDDGDLVRR